MNAIRIALFWGLCALVGGLTGLLIVLFGKPMAWLILAALGVGVVLFGSVKEDLDGR